VDVAPGNYVLELKRASDKDKWGFVWEQQAMNKRQERMLEKVTLGSPADEWAKAHPEDLRSGDQLVKVNGRGGRLEILTMELRKSTILCEFKPAVPRATAPLDGGAAAKAPGRPLTLPSSGGTAEKKASAPALSSSHAEAPLPPVSALPPAGPSASAGAGAGGVGALSCGATPAPEPPRPKEADPPLPPPSNDGGGV
jgi:hypothetical protein